MSDRILLMSNTFLQWHHEFVHDLQALLRETGTDAIYRIDPTTIATDVESPYVSKALGADRFMDFLAYREIVPEAFIAFKGVITMSD